MSRARWLLGMLAALSAQTVATVKVESRALSRTVTLSGELLPYQAVDVYARVPGFVERVAVDRGSAVKEGDTLAVLSAPEMEAQAGEAEAKVRAAESAAAEARARVTAAESTHQRLREAAQTAGAVSGNEVVLAGQAAEAARDAVRTAEAAVKAAQAALAAVKKMQQYLTISAPFSGVVTERRAHAGTLAGPGREALVRMEQVARLRLVVAVPETNYAGIRTGAAVAFTVPAHPARTFHGKVARVALSVEQKTRTMPVELDVDNAAGLLAPGMFAQVDWPVAAGAKALLVPATAVVRTTERVFVIRVKEGKAEWVTVRTGARDGALVQVLGELAAGDVVVKSASDEVREGAALKTN